MESKPSILIVDDDLSWQMIYQEIFEDEGYLVQVAGSREEADKVLAERVFDVAIIDLRLVDEDPRNMEGLETVKLIQDLGAPTRIIVNSGYLTAKARQDLEVVGVYAVLDKAGPVRQMTDLVAGAIGPSEGQLSPQLEQDAG